MNNSIVRSGKFPRKYARDGNLFDLAIRKYRIYIFFNTVVHGMLGREVILFAKKGRENTIFPFPRPR